LVNVSNRAALYVIKNLAIRRVNDRNRLTRLAGHRLVVNEVELHRRILRVKKPDHVAMNGLCFGGLI
jgi:hypothetical protein